MVLLAARLGFRVGDIRNLRLHGIDWAGKQISVIRHRTQKALLLPLPEKAGWAVIDYFKNGRPVTESPHVFARHRPPYDAFPVTSSPDYIFSSVMVDARLPPEKNTDVGWHTPRRPLAINLLQNNMRVSVISEILGYSVPDTAGKYYIQLDLENLKERALEMKAMGYVRRDS